MSAISTLSNSDLRLVTRLLSTLRKDHQINLGYRDPELDTKLMSIVLRINDPVVSALWNGLPDSFRGGSGDAQIQSSAGSKNAQADVTKLQRHQYRGSNYTKEKITNSPAATGESAPEQRTGGKYITYRGTKQWVPD